MTGTIRLTCAVGCVLLSGFVARASLADAILARGDDAARGGKLATAERYYERAETIGGDRIETLERFALFALLSPRGTPLPGALRYADAFVLRHPANTNGRFDRGLIEWRLRRYVAAEGDFRIAGAGGDPRARAFAAAARRRSTGESTP